MGKIKPNAVALSLIKGFDVAEGGGIELISHIITRHLKIPCSVLMGANLANEVAEGNFCETTIGCRDMKLAPVLRDLMQAHYFRVVVVDDVDAVEVCGALKVNLFKLFYSILCLNESKYIFNRLEYCGMWRWIC